MQRLKPGGNPDNPEDWEEFGGSLKDDADATLLQLIATSSLQARINHLRNAFNHVIEARNTCRDFRQSLPTELRLKVWVKLVSIETLCAFALIDADRAGVKGLKEPAPEAELEKS